MKTPLNTPAVIVSFLAVLFLSANGFAQKCPRGQIMTGIENDGRVICAGLSTSIRSRSSTSSASISCSTGVMTGCWGYCDDGNAPQIKGSGYYCYAYCSKDVNANVEVACTTVQ